jgi:hypothetical protein
MRRPKSAKPLFTPKKMTKEDLTLHRIRKEEAMAKRRAKEQAKVIKNTSHKVKDSVKTVMGKLNRTTNYSAAPDTLDSLEMEDDDESFIDPHTGAIKDVVSSEDGIRVGGEDGYTIPFPTLIVFQKLLRLSDAARLHQLMVLTITQSVNDDSIVEEELFNTLTSILSKYKDLNVTASLPKPKKGMNWEEWGSRMMETFGELCFNMIWLLYYPLLLNKLHLESIDLPWVSLKRFNTLRKIKKLEATPKDITTRFRYDWEKELFDEYFEIDVELIQTIIKKLGDYFSVKKNKEKPKISIS